MICLFKEVSDAGLFIERQKVLPVSYKGYSLDKDFIIGQLVENEIILALKSLDGIIPVHEAQLLTYLNLAKQEIRLTDQF